MATKEELLQKMSDMVFEMEDEEIADVCEEYIEAGYDALDGILHGLVDGMNRASEMYDQEEYFVTDLLLCSDAMYAGLEQRITNDFSGDEQAAQLKKLNECFNSAVQEYADGYEEQLTTVYNEFGINLDEFKIKASVTSLFAEKRDSYREFAKQNTDYAKLSQSEDKWLERDVKFMTNALRNAHSPAETETSLPPETTAANCKGKSKSATNLPI